MMVDLAEQPDEKLPTGIRAIAERQAIGPRYLEQIAAQLRKAGLVEAKLGQRGGYVLARSASSISVGEILEAVSGELLLVECLSKDAECSRLPTCRSRRMWAMLDATVKSVLNQFYLDDLMENRMPDLEQVGYVGPFAGCSTKKTK